MAEENLRVRREESVLSAGAAEPYDAVVFGSTGAVGREVVRALAQSEQCQSVVAIVRRFTQVSEWKRRHGNGSGKGRDESIDFRKVEVKRINFETIQTSLPQAHMRGKQVVTSAGYPHTSVWRPGLLDRGDKARAVEKVAGLIMKPMPVETVGRAMVVDAESKLGTGPEEDPTILYNKDIRKLADRGNVP